VSLAPLADLVEPATRARLAAWAGLPLRVIIGYGFMAHGFAKLGRGADHFAAILQALGMPEPTLLSWITILVEVLGGLAILVGAFVTIASLPMIAILLVAIFTVHLPNGFSSIKLQAVTLAGAQFGQPGYECDLLYLAGLLALMLGGPGPLAVDGYRAALWRAASTRGT
jgi:putative oxidoreductase